MPLMACGAATLARCQGHAPVLDSTDCDDTDPQRFQRLSAYRDADNDTHCAGMTAQMVCVGASLPSGLSNRCVDYADCDDNNGMVYAVVRAYRDADNDTHCANNTPMEFCAGTSVPAGYRQACADYTDCDDTNAMRYQNLSATTDMDGDRHCVGNAQMVCSGATLPAGLTANCIDRSDCDDRNANVWTNISVYRDADGDGACANGTATTACTNGSPPPQYTTSCARGTSDCNDANVNAWQNLTVYRDGDNDNACASSAATTACTNGSAPSGYRTSCSLGYADCNDSDAARYQNRTCRVDIDDDGLCSAEGTYCVGNTCDVARGVFGFQFTLHGPSCPLTDCNDVNRYVPPNPAYPLPGGWSLVSGNTCGYIRSTATGRYDHCCGGFCGQPNPYNNTWDAPQCPPGYVVERCTRIHHSGGGSVTVTTNGIDTRQGSCTVSQSCIGLEGSSDSVYIGCRPSP